MSCIKGNGNSPVGGTSSGGGDGKDTAFGGNNTKPASRAPTATVLKAIPPMASSPPRAPRASILGYSDVNNPYGAGNVRYLRPNGQINTTAVQQHQSSFTHPGHVSSMANVPAEKLEPKQTLEMLKLRIRLMDGQAGRRNDEIKRLRRELEVSKDQNAVLEDRNVKREALSKLLHYQQSVLEDRIVKLETANSHTKAEVNTSNVKTGNLERAVSRLETSLATQKVTVARLSEDLKKAKAGEARAKAERDQWELRAHMRGATMVRAANSRGEDSLRLEFPSLFETEELRPRVEGGETCCETSQGAGSETSGVDS